MFEKALLFLLSTLLVINDCTAQKKSTVKQKIPATTVLPGAHQMQEYLPVLKGKKVAMLVNHTSVVGNTHLVDTLLKAGVNVKIIFGPEHGFRLHS